MDLVIERLEAPSFLVAMPQVLDPFFRRSVVLLLEHGSEGTLGLIVNRETEGKLAELLPGVGLAWGGSDEDVAWFGGPVQMQVATALFSSEHETEAREVAPGIRFTSDGEAIQRLASAPPERFRFLLGYAGWSPGQLESEIARHDWLLVPFDADLLFGGDSDTLWTRALAKLGIRPESLPSMTSSGDDRAN